MDTFFEYPSRRRLSPTHQSWTNKANVAASATHRSIFALYQHIVDAVASSGVHESELSAIMDSIVSACREEGLSCGTDELISVPALCIPSSVAAAGRVILLRTLLSEESIWELEHTISEHMDNLLYSETPTLKQPVLISIRNHVGQITGENCTEYLASIVEEEVFQYDLAIPLPHNKPPSGVSFVPKLHLEIDGAHITDYRDSTTVWDTSTLLVFDDLVSDDLRRRLLDVIAGSTNKHQSAWDDSNNGPDPSRWVRGGLLDTPSNDGEEASDTVDDGSCWGLMDEAIDDICFQHHDAIEEFESILSALFPDFVVSRLPEAVFGSTVSPLTANAPTFGDVFNYHIDGDPNLAPPSPWTDTYGRYPNRLRGKPRFMSCLIYLCDEWDKQWGAPTRFLDIPTDQVYDVEPSPGRCVFMDQDISHTVVPPRAAAKKRPRYSLVWKLILHPRVENQDMTNLGGKRRSLWPEAIIFGSAQSQENR